MIRIIEDKNLNGDLFTSQKTNRMLLVHFVKLLNIFNYECECM